MCYNIKILRISLIFQGEKKPCISYASDYIYLPISQTQLAILLITLSDFPFNLILIHFKITISHF